MIVHFTQREIQASNTGLVIYSIVNLTELEARFSRTTLN